jgi:hypothetical protein
MNAALGVRFAFLGVFGIGFICLFAGENAILIIQVSGRGVQDKTLQKPMLSGGAYMGLNNTHGAKFPSLSSLAIREPERGIPLLVEIPARRILFRTRPAGFAQFLLAVETETSQAFPL